MIEFQYFEGCPNAAATRKNLEELVAAGVIDGDAIEIRKVSGPTEAGKLNFAGSPTILCDGIDLYTGLKPDSASFSCRIYSIEGKQTGVLSTRFIRERIEKHRH